jgi:pectinesterase
MKVIAYLKFVTSALAATRTSPPSGCLVVSKSPSSGQYSSVQAAINALSTTSSSDQCIFINPGTYSEQVLIKSRNSRLSIYGSTAETASYSQNKVTITASHSQAEGVGNDETATLRVKSANFRLYNVNVNNGHGKGSQAVALSAYADSGYYGCSFTGFQDTLLAQQGYQLYSHCYIQGATDFIFGQGAPAWFEKCDIGVVSASLGYVTGMSLNKPEELPSITHTADTYQKRVVVLPQQTPHTMSLTTATLPRHPVKACLRARTISAALGVSMPASSFRTRL